MKRNVTGKGAEVGTTPYQLIDEYKKRFDCTIVCHQLVPRPTNPIIYVPGQLQENKNWVKINRLSYLLA